MKNNILKYVAIVFAFQTLFACTPDKYVYVDTDVANKDSIFDAKLVANHNVLVANGSAEIDFRPLLTSKGGNLIADHRVQLEWLEYKTTDGKTITRNFSTSDASMIGKTISVYYKVKDTDITSNTVDVKIVAPSAKPKDILIPIVFHIVQTKEDIESYGGAFPMGRIEQILVKINNIFGNAVSKYSTGMDTRIKFQLAKYDEFGRIMPESGINRYTGAGINELTIHDIIGTNLMWSPEKYFNVWLISDRNKQIKLFGEKISNVCQPIYVNKGVDLATIPEGLSLTEVPDDVAYTFLESGVAYRLQNINDFSYSIGNVPEPGDNELIHYIARYFGLLRTFTYESAPEFVTDYCDDTIDYYFDFLTDLNLQRYKTVMLNDPAITYYFLSENIMDDPSGMHRVISQKQYERINWVLENCPERSAWKSSFAFNGK